MKQTSLHWCDKWRPEVHRLACACTTSAMMRHHSHVTGNSSSSNGVKRRRVATVHVCMAAIALAFLGGVAVGINGWLPAKMLRADDVIVTSSPPSSSPSPSAAVVVTTDPDASSLARRSQLVLSHPGNVSSGNSVNSAVSYEQDRGGDGDRTDVSLLRSLLLRRRKVAAMMTKSVVVGGDGSSPPSWLGARSWQQQQQQQQHQVIIGGGSERPAKVGEWVERGRPTVTRQMQPKEQRLVSVTAGLPQITRTYPLGLASRSHDGVPPPLQSPAATILVNHPAGLPIMTAPAAAADDQQKQQEEQDELVSYQSAATTDANMSAANVVVDAENQNGGKRRNTTANELQQQQQQQLVDGIYWSDQVEAMLPAGFSEHDVASWTAFSSNATVVKVVEGCGRMQNRMLVFDDGTRSCCRYRQNNDQIQGEIFSFYLARLLGLQNLPPASLGLLYGREWQWTSVRGQLTLAQWNEQKPVVMTRFIDGLDLAYIPRHFRGEDARGRRLHPVAEDLQGLTDDQVVELAQWSDLIVFDYVTANLDRVVNNMYNRQWNPDMMAAPAHNLAKQTSSGLLVFLDNESGLLHGYRLLDKYESYHRAMLQSLCVFRGRTVRAIQGLLQAGDVGARLRRTLHESQAYMTEWLPPLPDKSVKILRQRLEAVYKQVTFCERRYGDGGATVERYDDSPVTPDAL